MNGNGPGTRSKRDFAPALALVGLLLLPFLFLGLFHQTPHSPVHDREAAVEQVLPLPAVPDLPATGEDTVILSQLAADDAQARNAAVGFAEAGPGKATPFSFRGSSADRARARDCLALAGMAEAGGGDGDQRAVMQVILNRVRHPAFAKTVCGVVFEGSQRPTGCQFSFTCDGSLARRYSDAAWRAARARADEMLAGAIDATVGNATHFHANYVYPWWSDKLDKVAQVGPHIFFRWRGFWGTRNALSARYGGGEPDPLRLQETALTVATANPLPTLMQGGEAVRSITTELVNQTTEGGDATPSSPGAGIHFVLVSPSDAPAALVDKARSLCGSEGYCRVQGWSDANNIPAKLPLTEEAIFFDCRTFPAPDVGTCLPTRP